VNEHQTIGIALVGLGEYAESQILPALKETSYCRLSAVITDNEKNKQEVADKCGLSASQVYYYEDFEELKKDASVQLVYIIVPNQLHRRYCEMAASCGKHVLCEKPMAISVNDCRAMIDACNKHQVRLFIGYRLHFEPHHEVLISLIKKNKYGRLLRLESCNGFHMKDGNDDWRLKKQIAGGGSMMDMGIYIINECRQVFEELPISVKARKIQQRPAMFKEVEESLEWEMIYKDDRLAKGYCSYSEDKSYLKIEFEHGLMEVENAYKYEGLSIKLNGDAYQFDQADHKTDMLKHIATCILENKRSKIEPQEGLEDIQVIEAIYESMETGKPVEMHQPLVVE